jgi:hypothetical protein
MGPAIFGRAADRGELGGAQIIVQGTGLDVLLDGEPAGIESDRPAVFQLLAPGAVRLLQPLPHLLHEPLDDFGRGMAVGR